MLVLLLLSRNREKSLAHWEKPMNAYLDNDSSNRAARWPNTGMFKSRSQLDAHVLPALLYAEDALEPYISAETVRYHYGKHTQGYFEKLNELVQGTEFSGMGLEEIVVRSDGEISNNAGQAWNHVFYWSCLCPSVNPSDDLMGLFIRDFGSFEEFRLQFGKAAAAIFGSGWAWLVRDGDGHLVIESHKDAGSPLGSKSVPVLTCDVWEHAYYIDYRNSRSDYLDGFWNIVNWDFVEYNYKQGVAAIFH